VPGTGLNSNAWSSITVPPWATVGDESVVLPPLTGAILMQKVLADQVDAHRLLVQVGDGRTTSSYNHGQQVFREGDAAGFIAFVQQGSVKLTA
jgi:hypothetical protein